MIKTRNDKTIFIHSGSGLAFNAILQGKIVVSYQPIKSKWNKTLPNINSIKIKSEDELINFIKNQKFNKLKKKNYYIKNLQNIISNSIDYNASYKIASYWEKFKDDKLSKKNDLSKIIIKNKIRLIRQKLQYKVYNKKFLPFTNTEILNFRKILIRINPKFKDLKFVLIGPKLINISKI